MSRYGDRYSRPDAEEMCLDIAEETQQLCEDNIKIKEALTKILLHLGIEKDEYYEL